MAFEVVQFLEPDQPLFNDNGFCGHCRHSISNHYVTSEGSDRNQALLAKTESDPTTEGESKKNRVLLVASDGGKFFAHASLVCQTSPVLNRYYHGDYNPVKSSSGFTLKEANSYTVRLLLRFIYLGEAPGYELQSFTKLMQLAHFLQVSGFEELVVEAVRVFKEQKQLSESDWMELDDQLSLFKYNDARLLLYAGYAKA